MLAFLLSLAEAPFIMPRPIDPANWVTAADNPVRASNQAIVVSFSLQISPSGEVEKCNPIFSNGDEAVKSYTCSLFLKRGKFRAGQDEQGKAVTALWRSNVIWRQLGATSSKPVEIPPDIIVEVKELPSGLKSPISIIVDTLIDADGSVGPCISEFTRKKAQPLIPVACQSIKQLWTNRQITGSGGVPVKSMQGVLVKFEVAN